ncbi:hypothetical protein PHLGIDRAFT_103744 [Phlebiopsis gigantea 11061_1 CR5-6]|uniref:Terpene synthase n=1 Tax=Phlebiopsis gigantea (strain 11061_1 CR5-6) TaxID=745531 RepID=A0A0C3SA56_PHLG1|nr:hypothetical protein PHLGIDRAFT_103744 [Phlebiopsis gigantea 11061_1 CR5-6]
MPSAASQARSYRIPDLRSLCPWKASFNPNYDDASLGSSQWVLQYVHAAIPSKERIPFFEQKGSELLAAWTYPYADLEQLRTCCDFLNLLFVIDEVSECQGGRDAQATGATVLSTMKDATYDDGTVICKMVKDFKERLFPHIGPESHHRFIQEFERYLRTVTREAQLREEHTIPDLASYTHLRRGTSAALLCFELFSYLFKSELPNQVYHHPVLHELSFAADDMISWANDVYSYRLELSRGQPGSNVLSVLQQEMGVTLQDAADYVGLHFKELVAKYEAGKARMPSFGEDVDLLILQFYTLMECWVVGNIEWSFETGRYFGKDSAKVQATLIVELSVS